MRIGLFIDTPVFGGAEAVVLSLFSGLGELGFEPILYCFKNPELEARCRALGIEYSEAPAHVDYKSAWSLLSFARKFGARLRQDRVELLHSHLLGPIVGGHLSAKVARIPHVGTLHDSYTLLERPIWFRVLRLLSYNGTQLVAVSDQLRQLVARSSNLPPGRPRTIYNGLELRTPSSGTRDKVRQELGIADGETVVCSVGRLVALKRHELLIRAAIEASATDRIRLLIVGEGEEREALEALIHQLNAASVVSLLGFQSDVQSILGASDIFALTSSTEGLSCSIMEAMVAGLPCVVSDVGGNRELIQTPAQGLVLPNTDVASVASALRGLVRNPEARVAIGKAAHQRVLTLTGVAQMAREYAAVYEQCLGKRVQEKKVAFTKRIAAF